VIQEDVDGIVRAIHGGAEGFMKQCQKMGIRGELHLIDGRYVLVAPDPELAIPAQCGQPPTS
jgi:hypothetical protein